ncbi:Cycloartenol synthase 2 [Camellia lanceoleosa]|uniref:Cycloartenol synthase 2 n=1 Tax=Camellia lanceoleosa TaxID=1840588 RepID=A0ACC0FZ31_9ERIC|nr:Cycloartenol synthase 2 [Camellia lanceoleosa]
MTKPPQIAILGAGIFVRTQYIPRLTEISDLVVLKAIWSRTEESARAAIQALTSFKKLYPRHRGEETEKCIERAAIFIEKIQAPNGSWYGSWGVCFT